MARVPLSPFCRPVAIGEDPYQDLQTDVASLFDRIGRAGSASLPDEFPRLRVAEVPDGVEIVAAWPGVEARDVRIGIDGAVLTIAAERHRIEPADEAGRHWRDRVYGRSVRKVPLPFRPDPERIRAALDHGVLTVKVPRPAPGQGV